VKRLFPLLLAGLLAAGLTGCAGTAPASADAGSEPVPTVAAEPTPIPPELMDANARRLADAKAAIRGSKQGHYGMVPIYARDIADGTYPIRADSSSPFFKIADAELIVEGDEMWARITIPSMSYLWVYPGTIKEAKAAPPSEWVGFEEVERHTVFTLPLRALDTGVDCAAYSKARQKWYARTLFFYASSLPEEALAFPLPDYELIEAALEAYDLEGADYLLSLPEVKTPQSQAKPDPVAVELPDGEYSIEVNMTGGSGRASISSPTLLIVRGGHAYARLLWSSAYYDYMILDNAWFYNLTTDGGNSTFEIPVTLMDEPISITADTTAMGDPLEIEYTLTFYSDSVGEKGLIPQEAAKKVLVIAGVIIVLGGVLNYFVKKKRA
jgi:hypothetical protein